MSGLTMHCPACGKGYGLTPEYVAEYGGQTTNCQQCNGEMVIPLANAAAGVMPPALPRQPHDPTPGALGYATPQVYAPVSPMHLMRQGMLLVAAKDTRLPPNCVKCNASDDQPPIRRTYYWHTPALYFTILAGVFVYAIVALCVREKGTVSIHLCPVHRAKRRNGTLIGVSLVLLGVAGIVAAIALQEGLLAPFSIICLLVGAIWWGRVNQILTPKRIDKQFLYLKGVSPAYLEPLSSIR